MAEVRPAIKPNLAIGEVSPGCHIRCLVKRQPPRLERDTCLDRQATSETLAIERLYTSYDFSTSFLYSCAIL